MDRIAGHLGYLEKYGSPIFQNSFDVQNVSYSRELILMVMIGDQK